MCPAMQRRALIVDDEPATCELIERALNTVGIHALSITKSEKRPKILHTPDLPWRFSIITWDFQTGPRWLDRSAHHQGPTG